MSKHLTLDERVTIQVGLTENKTLGEIAKELGKSRSTNVGKIFRQSSENHCVFYNLGV